MLFKVFFSYAHEDEALRDELAKQLSLLKHNGLIDEWHDRRIVAGSNWASEIDKHLNEADIILLLISADFIASDYCYGKEVKRALERHDAGEVCVIPILLRPIDWAACSLNKLQALPTDERPVTTWANHAEGFANVAKGIREAVDKLSQSKQRQGGRLRGGTFQVPPLLPYLCDRSDQEIELRKALLLCKEENKFDRPFVCIMHGDQHECHVDFIDRLQHVLFPNLLNLKRRGVSIEDFNLPWPLSISVERAEETFLGALSIALDNTTATKETMFDVVPPERPIMVVLPLKTEDLARGGVETLSAFFKFWNDWPELHGRTLICIVSIRHQQAEKMGFFQRRRLKPIDQKVRNYLAGLQFSVYPKLSGVVLTELRAITHQEVIVWSRSSAVRNICNISHKAIDDLFERRDQIPMSLLADELFNLVKQYRN